MYKRYLVEDFLLLGCADRVCRSAARRTEESFLHYLGRKALNLPMDETGGLTASRADVIPLPT